MRSELESIKPSNITSTAKLIANNAEESGASTLAKRK
jgi:hypothetical protein